MTELILESAESVESPGRLHNSNLSIVTEFSSISLISRGVTERMALNSGVAVDAAIKMTHFSFAGGHIGISFVSF